MFDRTIFHIDVNSAFLSWEAVHRISHLGGRLDLRSIPSAVAGDSSKRRGIILAKSIPAKKYGVQTGEAVWEARRKCPDLVLVPPNYGLYQEASRAMMEILGNYSPDVEPYSIDEAFVDMTGTEGLWGDPLKAAHRIREQIRDELGFTVNIGISENKLLAKMASDLRGPDRVHTLFVREIPWKMWPLPVSDLFFVGSRTARKLLDMGIRTIGDLAAADPDLLRRRLKSHGQVIWAFANGADFSDVQSTPPANKGYGNSTTIPFDVEDRAAARLVFLALAETVASRLRKDGAEAGLVSVSVRRSDFSCVSHQRVLSQNTDITMEIHRTACELFDEVWDESPVRHLGIHTGKIRQRDPNRQIRLFDDMGREKLEELDRTVDAIRRRFGSDAVRRAAFAAGPIDHMEGGISREKRTADYSRLVIE